MSTRDLTKDFLRYRALRKRSTADYVQHPSSENDSSKVRLTGGDVEMDDLEGGSFRNDGSEHRQWMDYRDAVENNFYELSEILKKLEIAHKEAIESFDKRPYQVESERLANKVTNLLRDTDKSIKRIYVPEMLSEDPQENSIRKNVQVELSQKLYSLTVNFRKAQKDYMKKKMDQEHTLKEARKMSKYVDEKTAAEDISEHMIQELATTTNLINERDQEIANIAKSVQEIAEMFRDLSSLIIEQGTVLDRIDYNLEVALERTTAGVVHLEEAEKEQKKNRAVKCIFCLTLTTTICASLYILKKTNKF
jgi:syntaxin 16